MSKGLEKKSVSRNSVEHIPESPVREQAIEYAAEWEPTNEMEVMGVQLVDILTRAGGEAYFAGGYSRDLIMSQNQDVYPEYVFDPHDIDIATSLTPDEVEEVMGRHGFVIKSVGKNFQVVNVVAKVAGVPTEFEVATFRIEGDYGTDRKPQFVEATRDKREDIKRRDFTMNALLFDPKKQVVLDYVNGIEDIENRTLRFVGDAGERIAEDPLRILRYIRFLNKYDMKFDQEIKHEIRAHAAKIANLPAKRLRDEMDKILKLPRAAFGVADLARVGALEYVVPEVQKLIGVRHTPEDVSAHIHKEGDVFNHELRTLRSIQRPEFIAEIRDKLEFDETMSDKEVVANFYEKYGTTFVWANVFHDTGKADTQELLPAENDKQKRYAFHGHEQASVKLFKQMIASNRIEFSNREQEDILFLIENHMNAHKIGTGTDKDLTNKKKKKLFRNKNAEALLFLALADRLGNYSENATNDQKTAHFDRAWQELQAFKIEDQKRQEILQFGKQVSQAALDVFMEPGQDRKKGLPILGPVKDCVLLLLLQKRITEHDIVPKVKEINQVLETHSILDIADIATMKAEAQSVLAKLYTVDFDEL